MPEAFVKQMNRRKGADGKGREGQRPFGLDIVRLCLTLSNESEECN
jgi:hypothetical protein